MLAGAHVDLLGYCQYKAFRTQETWDRRNSLVLSICTVAGRSIRRGLVVLGRLNKFRFQETCLDPRILALPEKTRRAVGGDLIDMFNPRNCESRILHGEDRLAVGSEVISLKSWRLKHTGCYSRECDLLGWWRGALSIDTRRCLYVIFIALISD